MRAKNILKLVTELTGQDPSVDIANREAVRYL